MRVKIPLEPVPKGRARQHIVNGMVMSYTPKATAEAQQAIRDFLQSKGLKPFAPLVPLKLTASFWRCKSKWLKRRETMPFRKPDLDNYEKLLLDAIKKELIPDDAQITTSNTKKRWTPESQALRRGKPRPESAKGYIILSIERDKL